MTLPNFIVIGAAKSGTTSLYRYLREHPEIYMPPIKEPEFFSFMGKKIDPKDFKQAPANFAVTDWNEYHSLFKDGEGKKAIGEASPGYIYSQEAPGRIKEHIPHAKLIAILRDPAVRAYSHFNMRLNKSHADVVDPVKDFEEVLAAENYRIGEGWGPGYHYRARGFYYEQLKRYYDLFPAEQIRVYLYEDLRRDPAAVMKDIFQFLGVDDTFVPDFKKIHNKGRYQAVVKNRVWHDFLTRGNPVKTLLKPLFNSETRQGVKKFLVNKNMTSAPAAEKSGLDPQIRRGLVDIYKEDILKLEKLIGRDLSAWRV